MRKVALLAVVGLLCISLSSLAGEVVTNDTGADATGLRVVFSVPVKITAFGDTLMQIDPTSTSTEFVFSGGTVSPWGSHWMSWIPSAAQIVSHEWLTGSTATLQGLAAEQLADRPVVTGDLLNPDYFAHPAYVMQGVSEREAVFAMPLDGIEELAFYPTVDGVDLENVIWSVEVSHPEGIGANIDDGTLYIWGTNASWAGHGEVTLEATLGNAVSSVTIPVTVFREDKTLVNQEGKKDYFVPWSPELDINRVLSVEEHMRKYNKDEGNLDRTIQWSRWKKMEVLKDVDTGQFWVEVGYGDGHWPEDTQFTLVDVYLAELVRLGFTAFRTYSAYFISSETATDIHKLFHDMRGAPSKTPEEEAYIINEGHRLGLAVLAGNLVVVGHENFLEELYNASPEPLSEFIDNFVLLNSLTLKRYTKLGVDIADVARDVSQINQYHNSLSEATQLNAGIIKMAEESRRDYEGPIYHWAHSQPMFFPGTSIFKAPFWNSFDITGLSGFNIKLTEHSIPTVSQLTNGWHKLINDVFQPFQARQNKPFLMAEVGTDSVAECANVGLSCSFMPDYDPNNISIQDMADYYLAQSTAFKDMEGYFGPGWSYFSFSPYSRGGVRDPGFTFRLKIEDLLQSINLGKSDPRIIQIDAEFDDWLDDYIVFSDPVGDAKGQQDIISLSFTQDEDYLYFKAEYSAPLSNFAFIDILFDTNGDNRRDFKLFLNNYWIENHHDWNGQILRGNTTVIGFADAIDNQNQLEFRIAKRYIESYLGDSLTLLNFRTLSTNWELSDETGKIYLDTYHRN